MRLALPRAGKRAVVLLALVAVLFLVLVWSLLYSQHYDSNQPPRMEVRAATERGNLSIARLATMRSSAASTHKHPVIVDISIDARRHTIAIVNTKHNVWVDDRPAGTLHSIEWRCESQLEPRRRASAFFEFIETHGHTAVLDFGNVFAEGEQVRVRCDALARGGDYGIATLRRGILARSDNDTEPDVAPVRARMCATLFVRDEMDNPFWLLNWLAWHAQGADVGVEHTLVYINREDALDEQVLAGWRDELVSSITSKVTLVPLWLLATGEAPPDFADQQAQNMHALYSAKSHCRWLLATDIDEFVVSTQPLLQVLEREHCGAFAVSIPSHLVDSEGILDPLPQYGDERKGKPILRPDLITGFSVHMATDSVIYTGAAAARSEIDNDLHENLSPQVVVLAHFRRTTLRLLRPPEQQQQQQQQQAHDGPKNAALRYVRRQLCQRASPSPVAADPGSDLCAQV